MAIDDKHNYKLKASNYEEININLSHTNIDEIKNDIVDGDVEKGLNGMFSGEKINYTENQKVLHWVFRKRSVIKTIDCCQCKNDNNLCPCSPDDEINSNCMEIDYIDEEQDIIDEWKNIQEYTKKVREGSIKSFTGKKFNCVVNVGIGGSDLGNRLLASAFAYMDHLDIHFVSNVDPSEVVEILKKINIETTLFVVVSKTWSTKETLTNANIIKSYINEMYSDKYDSKLFSKNFVTISAKPELAEKFGASNNFNIWDYTGGRFSVWSAVALPIMISYGLCTFKRFLRGASMIDEQLYYSLKKNTFKESIFFKHANLEFFYMMNDYTKCIVPYSSYLKYYYKYLQQLEMESNGKHRSNMIIWGGVGTDVQHSFFQMMHQGDKKTLIEFVLPLSQPIELYENKLVSESVHLQDQIKNSTRSLVANCLAQSEALWKGQPNKDINKHFEGKKPSIIQSFDRITPEILGALLAYNEAKVVIQGFKLGINSFDQFGVTLGKNIAKNIEDVLLDVEAKCTSNKNIRESTIEVKNKVISSKEEESLNEYGSILEEIKTYKKNN